MEHENINETLIDSFHPCIKYKMQTDHEIDGTNSIMTSESMHFVKSISDGDKIHTVIAFFP